jgi:integrase
MATIEKRGARWRVRVRRDGHDISESFRTKSEAAAWAAQTEADILAGKLGQVPDKSFADLLRRYREDVSAKKDGARWELIRIAALLGEPGRDGARRDADALSHVRLPDLGPEHFAAWRDRRLREVSAATVRREWNLLSVICSTAVREWRWLREHPMRGVRRPDAPPPRTRRVSEDEIERILHACGGDYGTAQGRVGLAFLWAIETAMRAGEICALRWQDIDVERRIAHVAAIERGARKTRQARDVPLSREALRILGLLPRSGETVFWLDVSTLDALFRKAKARAMVEGLHFHDTRAEALTRLSKKLDVMQLARVSGHRDLRILYHTYYREAVEDIARRID